MPDEPDIQEPENSDDPGSGEKRGYMVYVAVALLGILVFMVIFMNPLAQGTTPATVITENTWALGSFTGADGNTTAVPNGTAITAKFSPDGKLTGSGSCTPYSARYMVSQTAIVISRVTASSPCTDSTLAARDARYYAAMENAAFLRDSNRQLTLYGTDGKPLLAFTPAVPGT